MAVGRVQPAVDVALRVPLVPRPLDRHGPDHSEDGAIVEGAVELSEAPLDAAVAAGVAAIQPVLVVEVYEPRQRIGVVRAPEHHASCPRACAPRYASRRSAPTRAGRHSTIRRAYRRARTVRACRSPHEASSACFAIVWCTQSGRAASVPKFGLRRQKLSDSSRHVTSSSMNFSASAACGEARAARATSAAADLAEVQVRREPARSRRHRWGRSGARL